jgi:hypothetical protein
MRPSPSFGRLWRDPDLITSFSLLGRTHQGRGQKHWSHQELGLHSVQQSWARLDSLAHYSGPGSSYAGDTERRRLLSVSPCISPVISPVIAQGDPTDPLAPSLCGHVGLVWWQNECVSLVRLLLLPPQLPTAELFTLSHWHKSSNYYMGLYVRTDPPPAQRDL